MVADEAIRSRGVRGREDRGPCGAPGLREAVVHVVRRVEAECRCAVLYHGKKSVLCAWACSSEPKRSGKSGRYLSVLHCASE